MWLGIVCCQTVCTALSPLQWYSFPILGEGPFSIYFSSNHSCVSPTKYYKVRRIEEAKASCKSGTTTRVYTNSHVWGWTVRVQSSGLPGKTWYIDPYIEQMDCTIGILTCAGSQYWFSTAFPFAALADRLVSLEHHLGVICSLCSPFHCLPWQWWIILLMCLALVLLSN